jgi:hypothetical protein
MRPGDPSGPRGGLADPPPSARAPGGRYDAFISYSHSADRDVAPKLQRALEVLAAPWFRARSLRVFRDQTDLAANPGLWPVLVEALDASQFFVLLASPQAATSVWVDRELEHWLARRPASSVLIVITAGAFAWDAAARDFDWQRTDCIPRRLGGLFPDAPTAADLRGIATHELGDPAFTTQVAKLASPIHGRSMRELFDPEMRRYRRRLRLVGGVAALLAVLLVVVAWQLFRIRAQSRRALAESLANRARIEQTIAPARAAYLAATADALDESLRSCAEWVAAAHGLPQWTTVLRDGRIRELADGGARLVLVDGSDAESTVPAPAPTRLAAEPAADPPRLRTGAGECIADDYFTPAPQGGDVWFCVASEIGFELERADRVEKVWLTVDGNVTPLPSPAACSEALLLQTHPVTGAISVARVDPQRVATEGHPVARTFDDDVEDRAPLSWTPLGVVVSPATTAGCNLLYLDETRQLRRADPEGEEQVSDASFGPVDEYALSGDGGSFVARHGDRFVVYRAEPRSAGTPAAIRAAVPLRTADGAHVGAALVEGEDGEVSLCAIRPEGLWPEPCERVLRPAPGVLGGDAARTLWDVSRSATGDVIVAADFPGIVACRPGPDDLECSEPFAIQRAARLAVAISADGRRAAASTATGVSLHDLDDPEQPRGETAFRARRLAFDGESLWMGSGDGLVRWSAAGEVTIDERPVAQLAVLAGGGAVVEDGGGQLRLARPDGVAVVDLGSLPLPATALDAAAAERLLAVGQPDGVLFLWDVDRRAEAARLALGGSITSAAFRADDRELWVVAGGRLTVLAMDRADLLRRTCETIRLSERDWLRTMNQVPPVDPCAPAGALRRLVRRFGGGGGS